MKPDYHKRRYVAGGSEASSWAAESAHSYAHGKTREVFVWIRHKTVRASLCVKVFVPLRPEPEPKRKPRRRR